MTSSILSGLRVLDFGRYIAAPFCASLLGELGAEVIRIEAIGGNDDRFVMPVGGEQGALSLQVNRNKVSLPLDMRHEKAPEVIKRLVESSDVVIANMVPETLARLGLDYISLCAIKGDIILTNVTAFGTEGPERNSLGFDGTGQAMSGAIHLSGVEGQPFRAAVSYVDYGTALASAFGTMVAIHARAKTGRGQEVQTSLLGTALTMMNPILIEQASGRRTRVPTGNRSPIAGPSDIFGTSDGWIMVQVLGHEMFQRWARLVGAEELVQDPRFADDMSRGEHGELLSERMGAWTRYQTSEACLGKLRAARIPGCPILSPAEALKERQLLEGGFFNWMDIPGVGAVPFASPVRLSDGDAPPGQAAPSLGNGSVAILRRVGFSASEIELLQIEGVI